MSSRVLRGPPSGSAGRSQMSLLWQFAPSPHSSRCRYGIVRVPDSSRTPGRRHATVLGGGRCPGCSRLSPPTPSGPEASWVPGGCLRRSARPGMRNGPGSLCAGRARRWCQPDRAGVFDGLEVDHLVNFSIDEHDDLPDAGKYMCLGQEGGSRRSSMATETPGHRP